MLGKSLHVLNQSSQFPHISYPPSDRKLERNQSKEHSIGSDSKYLQTYMNPITEVKIMAEVQAVKDLDKVKLISHLLERRYSKQMADVWNIGLNLALRISDLLSVKFNDIHDDRLLIKESKTGKLANIQLNKKALTTIKLIQTEHPCHVYLFKSQNNQ